MDKQVSISKESQKITCKDRSTWIPIYYSIKEDQLFTADGPGRYFVCNLINPNTEKDIADAVDAWKRS